MSPMTHSISIEVKSQPERRTINRAELAAITNAIKPHRDNIKVEILINYVFSINQIHNYAVDPQAFTHHPHKELLKIMATLLGHREDRRLIAHVGEVKSNTSLQYNDHAYQTYTDVADK